MSFLRILGTVIVATAFFAMANGSNAETAGTNANALEDFLLQATSQQDSVSTALRNGATLAPYFKFPKDSITYVTVATPGIDQKTITSDLHRFLTTAEIVHLSVNWCEIRLDTLQGELPACATDKMADVVVAYPESENSFAGIEDLVSRLRFKDEATAGRIVEKLRRAITRAERGFCLGSVVQTEGEIDAAFILSDNQIGSGHDRCSAFFAFAALGVRGSDLLGVMLGESDAILANRHFGQNSATALRFLYSKDVRPGMTNEAYVRELRRWLAKTE